MRKTIVTAVIISGIIVFFCMWQQDYCNAPQQGFCSNKRHFVN